MDVFVIANRLETATQQINRYLTIFLLLLGVIGNLCNCVIFTQRNLRSNPCSVYFLAVAIINLVVCIATLTPRSIDGWNKNADLVETVSVLCRLLMYLVFSTRCIASWFIAFASVDRYLVSSPNIHRRQMSTLKNAYLCIILICILSFLVWIAIFFCFDANQIGTPIKCYTTSDVCQMYINLAHAFLIVILPILVMLLFGFWTIANIRQRRRIVENSTSEQIVPRNRRSESSLTIMLLLQVFIVTLLSLPFAVMILYITWTFYYEKSLLQQIIEGFLFNMFLLMIFVPNCISFYLYTLSGSVFRQTFIDVGKKLKRYLPWYH
ncbi:hypothetical protein I4U23_015335 [Adineta vaga]|nr:hypothetical protein I4U23_015335 [Adineta vaga]